MSERYLVVDPATGETIDTIQTNDRILRKRSMEAYARHVKNLYELLEKGELTDMRFEEYSTNNSREIKALISHGMLTSDERAVLMTLSHYLGPYSHAVMNDRNETATLEEIAEIMDWSIRKMKEVMQGMIDKAFIGRARIGRNYVFFVNPWLCLRGTRINATLAKMFSKYRVMSKGGKTWGTLLKEKS